MPIVGDSLVQMYVWRVPSRRLPNALARMAGGRRALRRVPGVAFAKLLGTGSGDTFTTRDADLNHWAMLAVCDTTESADGLAASSIVRSWAEIAEESLRIDLTPLISRGQWSRQEPFAVDHPPRRWDGPVAALTRARIRPRMWRRFWSQVPPVADDLRGRSGLVLSLGIGEAPVGLQGTFSVWESNAALTEFAQRGQAHRDVIAATGRLNWYAEELFARFAVTGSRGSFNGVAIEAPPTSGGPAPS